jgi:ribosomal protein L11
LLASDPAGGFASASRIVSEKIIAAVDRNFEMVMGPPSATIFLRDQMPVSQQNSSP